MNKSVCHHSEKMRRYLPTLQYTIEVCLHFEYLFLELF